MNEAPKQFKTTVTVLLLVMDEHVTVLGFKCNLKVLEDVKLWFYINIQAIEATCICY